MRHFGLNSGLLGFEVPFLALDIRIWILQSIEKKFWSREFFQLCVSQFRQIVDFQIVLVYMNTSFFLSGLGAKCHDADPV